MKEATVKQSKKKRGKDSGVIDRWREFGGHSTGSCAGLATFPARLFQGCRASSGCSASSKRIATHVGGRYPSSYHASLHNFSLNCIVAEIRSSTSKVVDD